MIGVLVVVIALAILCLWILNRIDNRLDSVCKCFRFYELIFMDYIYCMVKEQFRQMVELRETLSTQVHRECELGSEINKLKTQKSCIDAKYLKAQRQIDEYKLKIDGKDFSIKKLTKENNRLKQKVEDLTNSIESLQDEYDRDEYARLQLLEIKEDIRRLIKEYNYEFRDSLKQPTNDEEVVEFDNILTILIDRLMDKVPDDTKRMSSFEMGHLQAAKKEEIWKSICENANSTPF